MPLGTMNTEAVGLVQAALWSCMVCIAAMQPFLSFSCLTNLSRLQQAVILQKGAAGNTELCNYVTGNGIAGSRGTTWWRNVMGKVVLLLLLLLLRLALVCAHLREQPLM